MAVMDLVGGLCPIACWELQFLSLLGLGHLLW